jgi:hypothetical protein
MRKVIVGAFLSLDGIMQSPGGPKEDPTGGFKHGGWVVPHFDETAANSVGEMFAKPFDLLLGRKTYEIFAAHWPYVGADDPIGPLFDRITKRLFGDGASPAALKLASSKSSASGVTISKYLRAGQVATGSFQLEPPIEAELERRRNLN